MSQYFPLLSPAQRQITCGSCSCQWFVPTNYTLEYVGNTLPTSFVVNVVYRFLGLLSSCSVYGNLGRAKNDDSGTAAAIFPKTLFNIYIYGIFLKKENTYVST